jgi:hypothetical protein
MATVDIEPASLTVTPGESHVLTLTITNDGDEVEAYHLTAVDDAAAYVTIAPDTLLVHPGETASAAATLLLENTGMWPVGDVIVRFHIVPAGRPDEFLIVEAIAAIRSFSDVAAVLSQPALEARRSAATDITITNAGNAHTFAEISVSGGEVSLLLRESHVSLPAGSAETVRLGVASRSLIWSGTPVQHPFAVTVSPEGEQTISLEGTFTQLPVLPKWWPAAAIAAGGVALVALVVWVGSLAFGGGGGATVGPTDSGAASESASAPPPEPEVRMVIDAPAEDELSAGDNLAVTLAPEVEGAPDDSLLAMEVEWPEELTLADFECVAWTAPRDDRVLQGEPQPGDECLVNTSGAGRDAVLTFTTPPEGLEGAVSAGATRLVTLDGENATTLKTGPEARFGSVETAGFDLAPYPFWMQVVDVRPNERGVNARVVVNRTMRGDGTDEEVTMSFEIGLPNFVSRILDSECDGRPSSTICTVDFGSDADAEENTRRVIDLYLDVDEGGGIGLLTATGDSVEGVASNQVDEWIRDAEGLLVSERLFGVDVKPPDVDDSSEQGDVVTVTIDIRGVEFPADVTIYRGGQWTLGLELEWPEGLEPVQPAVGCELTDRRCTLPPLREGEDAQVTIHFTVVDAGAGEIRASGASLTFDPTTAADIEDGRTQPSVELVPHWIGTNAEELSF